LTRVSITTYNRNAMVDSLVDALVGPDVDIHVYDDGSPVPVELDGATVHRYDENAGRDYWFMRVHDLFVDASIDLSWEYMLWAPDDVMPARDDLMTYLPRAFRKLQAADSEAVCLNPIKLRHHPCVQWVPAIIKMQHGHCLTRWMDCCGIVDRRFVESAIPYLRRHLPHYCLNEHLGTQVGRAASFAMFDAGYNIYQVRETLFSHGNHPSVMAPLKNTDLYITP